MSDSSPPNVLMDIRQCLEQARQMTERARSMWCKATTAYEETLRMREHLQEQVRNLLEHPGFRQKYINMMLPRLLEDAIVVTSADMGNIQLLDESTGTLRITAHSGFDRPFLEFFDTVHSAQAACGTALKDLRRVVVNDVTDSPIFANTPSLEIVLDARVRSVQSTPFLGRQGNVLGVLSTHHQKPRVFTRNDLRAIDYFAEWLGDLIELCDARKAREPKARHEGQTREPRTPVFG